METYFLQVRPGDATAGSVVDDWTPWIDCKPGTLDQVQQLAAHKHIRERGGVDEKPYTFTVYSYTSGVDQWPNGRPKKVNAVTMVARKT